MLVICCQGGFAKCYEMTDVKTNKTYAGKIIAKARIVRSSQRDKVRMGLFCILFELKKNMHGESDNLR